MSVRPLCTPHVVQSTSTIHRVGSCLLRDQTGLALTTDAAELHILHIACVGGTATRSGYCLTSGAENDGKLDQAKSSVKDAAEKVKDAFK